MTNDTINTQIAKQFIKLEQVEAVLLAGSRTANTTDRHSDYDFYIYTSEDIDPSVREGIAAGYASSLERVASSTTPPIRALAITRTNPRKLTARMASRPTPSEP